MSLGIIARSRRITPQKYITRVEAALGSSITTTQRDAIITFYNALATANLLYKVRYMAMPIWSSAAANAIDLINGTVGTFNGTFTHGTSGGTQPSGSSYFDTGVSPARLGLTTSSATIFILSLTTPTQPSFPQYFAVGSSGRVGIEQTTSGGYVSACLGAATVAGKQSDPSTSNGQGIWMASIYNGSTRYLARRTTLTGHEIVVTASSPPTGFIPAANITAWCLNQSDTAGVLSPGYYCSSRMGAFGLATGFSHAEAEAFSGALQFLWEICTRASLP